METINNSIYWVGRVSTCRNSFKFLYNLTSQALSLRLKDWIFKKLDYFLYFMILPSQLSIFPDSFLCTISVSEVSEVL